MLTKTFIHIDGISYKNERVLWETGFNTWWDVLDKKSPLPFSEEKNKEIYDCIMLSAKEFMRDNLKYFIEKLPHKEYWRVLSHYRREIGYIDIETNMSGQITVVGLYTGKRYFAFKAGDDSVVLEKMMSIPSILVSFNGMAFDIPKIREQYPYISLPKIHFDLLKASKSVGWKGGLKKIEGYLGIERPESVKHMTGYDAVLLWDRYRNGSKKSLEVLVEYNMYDVVNLEILLDKLIEEKTNNTLS